MGVVSGVAVESCVVQGARSLDRGIDIVQEQGDGANARAMRAVVGVGETVVFEIEHEMHTLLGPVLHGLRTVCAGACEAERQEQVLEGCSRRGVDGEFDECEIGGRAGRWQRGRRRCFGALREINQRAITIRRGPFNRSGAKLIVEDLERQGPIVAGIGQVPHEGVERQFTLSREATVVPAPRQLVHGQSWCVGNLHQENAVARNGRQRAKIGLAGKNVKRIETQTHRFVIGATDNLPAVSVVVDMPTPRQRLVGDADTVFGGVFAESREVVGGPVDSTERPGRCRAAHHEQGTAERRCEIELASRAIERPGAFRFG